MTFAPILEFEFVNKPKLLEQLLGCDSGPYDALIATSARSLEAIRELLGNCEVQVETEIRELWKSKILFSVGLSTTSSSPLEFSSAISVNSDGEQLANFIIDHYQPITTEAKPARLLFLCSDIRRHSLPDILSSSKHPNLLLHELVVYSTKKRQDSVLESAKRAQWWVFFSPSGVDSMNSMLIQSGETLHSIDKRIASIGKTTSDALRKEGVHVDAVASTPSPESLLGSIKNFIPQ